MSRLHNLLQRVLCFFCNVTNCRCERPLLDQKRQAVEQAAEAAVKVKHRVESPRVRLIVQSADDLGAAFTDGQRR